MAAADWSHLPSDLLSLITTHLDTPFDLLRFRSVCPTWRHLQLSLPSPPPLSSPILPVSGISNIAAWGFYVFKRSIFILSNPEFPTQSWLVKVEQENSSHLTNTHLVNPLFRSRFDLKLLEEFPKRLDLMGIRVSELGSEYVLQHISYWPFPMPIGDACDQYMEKVALLYDSRFGYVILTIHVSGTLVIIKIGDKDWTVISDSVYPYDDVVLFNGRFYAVDEMGRFVVVKLGCSLEFNPVVELVANPFSGGDKKTLVLSCGELLLVDTYSGVGPKDDVGYEEEVEFYEEFDCYMSERFVRFRVFKLNWGEKKWDEVKDLCDKILILGDCAFSATSSYFDGCKGNCIIFAEPKFYASREEGNGEMKGRGACVFDLESGRIGSLSDYPCYSKMFCLPPSWICSATLKDDMNQLQI